MKRIALLLFAVILSTVMMAQRKETTILEVSGNLATPLTVHTSKGTYTLYDFMELNGVVSVRSAEDVNGDKVVVSHEYKSHTSNGKSEYTRIYRFKTLYNKPSSSSSNSGNSYGGGSNGGSSYGGGSYSNGRMPYEHLRNIAERSDNIYGTWYHHREVAELDMYFESLMTIASDEIIITKNSIIEGESSLGTPFTLYILNATDNEINARYDGGRDYKMYAGDRKNGRTVAYDESYTDYFIKLVNGEIQVTTNTVIKFYDKYNNYITEENVHITKADRYLSVPDQL